MADDAADDAVDDAIEVEASEGTELVPDASSSEVDDDVVVDLFARIRAENETDHTDDDRHDDGGGAGVVTDDTADVPANADDEVAGADDAAGGSEPDDDGVARWGADEPAPVPSVAATSTAEAADDDARSGDQEPTPFERRDEELTPLIVASARKLKRVLADEQNEVLDALRRSDPVRDLDMMLPPVEDQVSRYVESIGDDLRAAAGAGAASVATGRAAKLKKAAADHAVGAATDVLDQWLVAPLRERLDRAVSEGDGDNDVITKKVRAVYREWKTQHIDEQLDDVLLAAHGRGVLAAIEPGAPVAWVVDGRHGTCADCDDNALAGALDAGAEFPTGHTFAPAHPGCRCLLSPVDR